MKTKKKLCKEDRIYYTVSGIVITLILVSVLYPIIYIVSASFSSGQAVMNGKVILWPVDLCFDGYKAVFAHKDIVSSYANSIFYTVVGTLINLCMTMIAAYPLARKDLPGRGCVTFFFTLTMFISGGMIPNYLVVKNLGMLNTRWALLIPGAISTYNMFVVKNFIQSSIPGELLEAAQIDGCSDTNYFFSIVLPLSKASIAVVALYYAVGHWNSYFNALMYLNDRSKIPLQLVLREILVNNQVSADMIMDPELYQQRQNVAQLLKYSLIVVSSVPMICIYPFVQKHFVKGVMVGSVKG